MQISLVGGTQLIAAVMNKELLYLMLTGRSRSELIHAVKVKVKISHMFLV
jgi:hypothetical protein